MVTPTGDKGTQRGWSFQLQPLVEPQPSQM